MRIGIDAGGTFTDFVVLEENGRLTSFKLRSDRRDPSSVILSGIARAAKGGRPEIVHGSTVATNALLERKGARTAFVATAGFEDLVAIGRQNRAELYNLTPPPKVGLATLSLGIKERAHFDGTVERRPSKAELTRLRRRLEREGVESVAICLLHSCQNPENEQSVAEALAGMGFVSASHEVSPEYREYERASTTVINAYVGPLMDAYLAGLEGLDLAVMQSNGGVLTAAEARRHAVRTILSGPAGGVVGAAEVARADGYKRILGFDMGGTSTDVSLAGGAPRLTTEAAVDGFPVRVPMLDIHTVGAGGGSIARVDEGGLLRVGPESAGADPGPACYGTGTDATVTDAHVVLGRIAADQFLGGEMSIEPARSEAAVDELTRKLEIGRIAAAAGVIRVANANMERAIRVVSVEKGQDPRDYALVAFGGCGGLHACEMAANLGIRTVLVPRLAGALSALGMLLADRVRDYSASALEADAERRFAALEKQARRDLRGARLERSADLRYLGQSYELTVDWESREAAERAFHAAHRSIYGYANPDRAVQVVTVRVKAVHAVERPRLREKRRDAVPGPRTTRRVYSGGRWEQALVLRREQLASRAISGPALVVDYGSTTLVPRGWRFSLSAAGTLVVKRVT